MYKKKVKMLSRHDDFSELSIVCKLMQTKVYVMKYFVSKATFCDRLIIQRDKLNYSQITLGDILNVRILD